MQVHPKGRVRLQHLLFLLGYAPAAAFRDELVSGEESEDLLPGLAWSLRNALQDALVQGVLQGYRTVDEALGTVRGRIRVSDQLRHRPGLMMPIEVSYDDFTVDTAENRILRTALRTMLAVPGLDAEVRRTLAHLDGRLEGVSVLSRGSGLPRWVPSRLNQRYQSALRLAELILRFQAADPSVGDIPMAGFVVPMWHVFERFVGAELQRALADRPGSTTVQHLAFLTGPGSWESGQTPMYIDVLHRDAHGAPDAVFDAKYKVSNGSNADDYQMLAYCTATGLKRAFLVTASSGRGHHDPVGRKVKNTTVEIVEYPLDLSQRPAFLLESLSKLASYALPK